MVRKKHPFHCEKCNAECMIYKKGRAHRVFVCPNCGVLATNGKLNLGRAGSGATLGATIGSVVPGLGTAVGGAVGGVAGAVSGLFDKGDKANVGGASPKQKIITDSLDKANKGERYVKLALGGKNG